MSPLRIVRRGAGARSALALLVALVLLPSAACGEPTRAEAGWSYVVGVSPALDRLRVSMRFPGTTMQGLTLDDQQPAPWIVSTSLQSGEAAVTPGPNGFVGPIGSAAFAYEVDVAKLTEKPTDSARIGSDVVLRVGRWLLRPSPLPAGASATLAFNLPKDVHVSTPWPGRGSDGGPGPYRLDESTFTFWGHVAFGRFDVERSRAAGCTVDLAALEVPRKATSAGLTKWVDAALEAHSTLFGGYPRRHLQVLVRPGIHSESKEPVDLGATFPGGGAVLHGWIPASTDDQALVGEWVAVHELVHLAMPAIRPEDSWLSEGVATYYQEVLRSRAWWKDEARGWKSLAEGLAWGRSQPGGPPLRELAQDMHRTGTFYRTYWSGAAVAAIADAEIRRATQNKVSLDDAMRLWAKHVGSPRLYTGDELLHEADAALPSPVIGAVYQKALAAAAFPDVGESWAWLGVVVGSDGKVTLKDDAPGAAARKSIMGPRAAVAAPAGAEDALAHPDAESGTVVKDKPVAPPPAK